MAKEEYITTIDVGSSNIRTVITQLFPEEKPRIIGVGQTVSNGMRKGTVADLEEVSQSIKSSLEEAEKIAGIQIENAYVSISGSHLQCLETKGVIAIGKADGEVTEDDVQRVIEASRAINLPHNYELLHIIPQKFILDDQEGIKDPIGMSGVRLEMKGLLVIGFTPHIKNISKCVFNAGVDINNFIVAPLAAAKSILNKRQEELGVVLMDIGGGTTSLAVYEERELIYSTVVPVGASHITNDIAIGLRTSIEVAEKVKIGYGSALPSEISKEDQVNLSEIDSHEEGSVSRKHIAEIIEARTEEIFILVEKELKKINKSALLPAGVVLVGGGAHLQGAVDLAKDTLKLPAQVGFPIELSGLVDKVDSPSFAVSIGMILWVLESEEVETYESRKGGKKSTGKEIFDKIPMRDAVSDIKKWFVKFLP